MNQRLTCGHSQPIDKREHFLVPALPAQVPKISLWQGLPQGQKSKQPAKGCRKAAFAAINHPSTNYSSRRAAGRRRGQNDVQCITRFFHRDSLQSLTLDFQGNALQLRLGIDEVLARLEIEFPAVPRAAQDAAFATVIVFINRRGQRRAGNLPDAHGRSGVRADVAVGEKFTTNIEHSELNLADRNDLTSAGGISPIFATRCEAIRFLGTKRRPAPGRRSSAFRLQGKLVSGRSSLRRRPATNALDLATSQFFAAPTVSLSRSRKTS